MIQTSKQGFHVQNSMDIPAQVAAFEEAQPLGAKLMADEPDMIDACKEVSPDTFWGGRVWRDNDDQDVSNPQRAALQMRDSILRRAICRKVDA